MGKKLKIAVIFGGKSGEHEVSLVSARSVISALDTKKYSIIQIGITKKGEWLSGKNALSCLTNGNISNLQAAALSCDNKKPGVFVFKNGKYVFLRIDVAFPVFHGPYGEDGTIQGMLEMAAIPYVGCGVLASAACMDKFTSKIIFKMYGIPQAKFLQFSRSEIKKKPAEVKKQILKELGLPCFIKPANLGSSVGISKAKTLKELMPALLHAATFDSSVLAEETIDAREIECAVLGNQNPLASIAGEIVPNREFYDYYAKYVDDASKLFIPAKIPTKKMREVQALAISAYKALQCSGMARADFLMDRKTNKLYINELNTIPGFTSISMYPKLWEASGISYAKLLDRLVELALERHIEKQKTQMNFESGSQWYKA